MAGKSARLGNSKRGGSAAADAADAADASIARLIDGPGDGTGQGDSTSRNDLDYVDGSESDGGRGEATSAIGAGPSGDNHRDADARTGSGKRTGTRSRSTRTGDDDGAAREEKKPLRETVPQLEKPNRVKGKVDDEKVELPASSAELIGDLYSVIFWMVGQATQVPEWRLRETEEVGDEAEFLGDKTEKFIKSLGKRRATNLMKSLGKVGPALGFMGAVAMITAPRVKLTIHRAKHGNPKPISPASSGNSGAATTAAESTTASDHPIDPATSDNNGDAGLHERSFTAADFGEVTQGHVNESARDYVN